jgi:hypothetical protein
MKKPEIGRKTRLESFIELAKSGKQVKIEIDLYTREVKQMGHPEETDDVIEELDMCLLIADFIPKGLEGEPKVTKVYAVCPINESDVDAKITRYIANERLKMDYKRLQDGKIKFEEKFF